MTDTGIMEHKIGNVAFTLANAAYDILLLFVINAYLTAFNSMAEDISKMDTEILKAIDFEFLITVYKDLNNGLGKLQKKLLDAIYVFKGRGNKFDELFYF